LNEIITPGSVKSIKAVSDKKIRIGTKSETYLFRFKSKEICLKWMKDLNLYIY